MLRLSRVFSARLLADLGPILAGLVLATPLFAAPLWAQDLPGDPAAGLQLARDVCAECHEVERGNPGMSLLGAPSFQEVAERPAVTALGLRVFLRTPHAAMPDLILDDDQTEDIIAYILSLQ
jgi:mono/diheme cytochrome c family protein